MSLPHADDNGLISRAVAARTGVSDAQLRRLTQRNELRRLHRGTYASAAAFLALDGEARHGTTVRAALAAQRTPSIVSHASAAILYGLPNWNLDLSRVHLTQARDGAGRRTGHLHIHQAPAESVPTRRVGDELLTSPARTLFDVAATVGFEEAVILVDAALHTGLTTRAELTAELSSGRGRHGRQRAAAVFGFADERSESVGESRSRVGIFRSGLAVPTPQFEVRRADGMFVARTDFCWAQLRLLGEFDGLAKYGRLLRPGEQPGDAVTREKLREDALRELEYRMVRWVWAELGKSALYVRIGAAIERARRVAG